MPPPPSQLAEDLVLVPPILCGRKAPTLESPFAIRISTSMGKRAQRERNRRRLAPPALPSYPLPPAGSPSVEFAHWLGASGIILVLFETPSGFAVLHYDGVKLFRPNALRDIWSEFIDEPMAQDVAFPKEFRVFNDKTRAINSKGVCASLANMIKRSLWPGQRLAVGKREYKDIIEANLGIPCLFDDAVLEVMWGLKYLIKFLVPDEKLELTDEDRFQMCEGLKLVLNLYGFNVESKMLNSDIIYVASVVYECDRCVDKRASHLDHGKAQLLKVSNIEATNWDELKLATALKLICYPEEAVVSGDAEDMLSKSEVDKLLDDAPLYEGRLHKPAYLKIYKNFVWVRGVRSKALLKLDSMFKEETRELKLHQELSHSFMVKGSMEELQLRELSSDFSMVKETQESDFSKVKETQESMQF